MDAEDFLPVTATYPQHPLSKVDPSSKNIEDMVDKRKASYKQDVMKNNAAHEKFRASSNPAKAYVPSEFFGNNKYSSVD